MNEEMIKGLEGYAEALVKRDGVLPNERNAVGNIRSAIALLVESDAQRGQESRVRSQGAKKAKAD